MEEITVLSPYSLIEDIKKSIEKNLKKYKKQKEWTNYVYSFVYNGVINNEGIDIMKRDIGNYGADFQWLNNEI